MKFLDKLGLAIFSLITLILSILVCLIAFGWIDVSIITVALTNAVASQNGMYITIGVCVVLVLLSIKCLFFPSYERRAVKEDDEEGILLQNDNGKLLITKGTIKNLVNGTVDDFKNVEAEDVQIALDQNNDVYVNLEINVNKETIIKDVSTKLQNKIKENVKKATDLEIKEINIKVNDVEREEVPTKEEKKVEATSTSKNNFNRLKMAV